MARSCAYVPLDAVTGSRDQALCLHPWNRSGVTACSVTEVVNEPSGRGEVGQMSNVSQIDLLVSKACVDVLSRRACRVFPVPDNSLQMSRIHHRHRPSLFICVR